jgi:hypothetical protein
MEADDFALDVRMAQSELDEARAHLTLAEDAAARQAQLLGKMRPSDSLRDRPKSRSKLRALLLPIRKSHLPKRS